MRFRAALAPGLVFAFAATLLGQEAELSWRTDGTGYRAHEVVLEAEAPDGVRPPAPLPGLRWLRGPLGEEIELLLAVSDEETPRLWLDRDFDGELIDETALVLTSSGGLLQVTESISVPLSGGAVELPFRFYRHRGKTCLHLGVLAHREGRIVLEGRERRVLAFDEDGDLRFDGDLDLLLLDVDGDGEVTKSVVSPERLRPGEAFRVGERGYVAKLATSLAGSVRFEPVASPPPWPEVRWARDPVPASGLSAPGTSKSMKELLAQYRQAEEEDRKLSASSYTKRRAVVLEMGKAGTEEAFRHLLRIARNESIEYLVVATLQATGFKEYAPFSPEIAAFAREERPIRVRIAAMTALHRMDAPDRVAVYRDLFTASRPEELISAAAEHLAHSGEDSAFDLLEEAARSGSTPALRYHGYRAATGWRSDPPAPDLVRSAAAAAEPGLRALGLAHARTLRLPDSVSLARDAIRGAKYSPDLSLEIVTTLGTGGSATDVPAILSLARPEDREVRDRAREVLSPVRDEAWTTALLTALEGAEPHARSLAAEVLVAIPDQRVLPALLERLEDEKDIEVRAAIVRTLGKRSADGDAEAIARALTDLSKEKALAKEVLTSLARIGFDVEAVRKVFSRALSSRDWEERVVAADIASHFGDAAAAPLLVARLDDRVWQVRLTAIQGLGLVRAKSSVLPLIELLETEESPRLKREIARSLYRITGRNFYDLAELWRRWWEAEGESFQIPATVPDLPPQNVGGSAASFYGLPVESERVIFVLDQSGSMSATVGGAENRLDQAVKETLKVVEKLDPRAKVNVILFETAVHPWQDRLLPLGRRGKAALAKHLGSKQPTGGTNLYDALEMALLMDEVDSIYLLSDGAPGSGKFTTHADILREVKRLNETRKIAIHTVSLGLNSPLLRDLAAQNGGEYIQR